MLNNLNDSIFLSIQDLENEQEHVDDVEIECDGCEDVAVLVEFQLSVLATDDELRVVNQEEAVDEDTEAGIGQVHLWTEDPHHKARHRHDHGEDPDECTTHCEVCFGRDCVEGEADDHGCCDTGSLKDNGWRLGHHANDADHPADAEGKHGEDGVVVGELAIIATAGKGAN